MSETSKICSVSNNKQGICLPQNNDIWYKNTYNLITWSLSYQYYRKPESPTLNIYFYYQENYQYYHTVNFTNININDGYHVIYINDSFFPNNNETNKKWEYMAIIVGNSTDPDKEINNIFSNFPKINFYVIQNTSILSTSTIYTQSSTLIQLPTSSENSITIGNTNYSSSKNNIETWKIIVITICCILFILISFFGIWIYRKKRFFKNIKENNENNENNVKKEYEEFKNIKIIYEKPDLKDSKVFYYQKPNQIN